MSYSQEAFSLHSLVLMSVDLERSIDPAQSERTNAFKRDVLEVLRKHQVTVVDLQRPVYGDYTDTVFGYLRGNPKVAWNVLVLLSDWMVRYETTGYDFVAAWIEALTIRGC